MDKHLRALVEAPLADPLKINLPEGKRALTRGPKVQTEKAPGDLTLSEVRERKRKELEDKQSALLDYYATTDKDAATVAKHVGLTVLVDTGRTDEDEKPIYERVFDVARAQAELDWRRKARG